MALRIPPGRAGRTWLIGRLDVAHRGAELLDRKRQVLLSEQARIRAEAERARRDWNEAAAQVETWTSRAGIVDGADASSCSRATFMTALRWRSPGGT